MPDIHPIRLRGPWLFEVLDQYPASAAESEAGQLDRPLAGTTIMPADWSESLGAEFRGRVCYRRKFGCPTGLESHETVYLVLEAVDARGKLTLNGPELGEMSLTAGLARMPITHLLQERNELVVQVELPVLTPDQEREQRPGRSGLAGGIVGEVRLEIQGV